MRGAGVAALALAITLAAAGCTSSSTLQGGTGGQGGSGGGSGGSSGTSGTITTESDPQSIPTTFPDIPLVAGEVVVGLDVGTSWTVILRVDDAAAAFTEGSALLVGAGYTIVTEVPGAIGVYANPEYQVQFLVDATGDDGPSAIYSVTPVFG